MRTCYTFSVRTGKLSTLFFHGVVLPPSHNKKTLRRVVTQSECCTHATRKKKMANQATVTGTLVSYGKKTFKGRDGKQIEFTEVTIADPTDSRNPIKTFTVDEKIAKQNELDRVGDEDRPYLGETFVFSGELSSQMKQVNFLIGEKEYKKYVTTLKFRVTGINPKK